MTPAPQWIQDLDQQADAMLTLLYANTEGKYFTGLILLAQEIKQFTRSFARPHTGPGYTVRSPNVVLNQTCRPAGHTETDTD